MQYPHGTARVGGILTPLAAIPSDQSIGCGEFPDLVILGRWCNSHGMRLIQLLPVNDTGTQSSPYSALSAFALHPIYARVADFPEFQDADSGGAILAQVDAARAAHKGSGRFAYQSVLSAKMELLRALYTATDAGERSGAEIDAFITEHPWIPSYAVFRYLKEKNAGRSWRYWDSHREAGPDEIKALWNDPALRTDLRFFAWLQMRLSQQLRNAALELDKMGVALKGDIPILMNEDSVDVWADREIFITELRAGAPPDMFSHLGQNWDFPIYNWQRLAERDYDWWRARLREAAQYYHAYRIDHVLGFFRIWAIPRNNFSGIPGFFWPQRGFNREELHAIGFDDGRIRWLAEPHLRGHVLRDVLGESFGRLPPETFAQVGTEDLYLFGPGVRGELDIEQLGLNREQTEFLLSQFRNRALIALPNGEFAASWTYHACDRFENLFDDEKERLRRLIAHSASESNELWARHAYKLLKVMRDTTEMLTCAENLGVVPEAVPRVLDALGILSLYIPRWAHYWDKEGQPPIPPAEYRPDSVCAPSVHDTSTVRGWWQTESGRDLLWRTLGLPGDAPAVFDAFAARTVYEGFARSASRILVLQIQDLLVFEPRLLHPDVAQERVNVPGSYNDFNWTYRLPILLEEFVRIESIGREVETITAARS